MTNEARNIGYSKTFVKEFENQVNLANQAEIDREMIATSKEMLKKIRTQHKVVMLVIV